LWPETIVAIREALHLRPYPDEKKYTGHVFLTRFGKPWVRVRVDGKNAPINSITLEFGKLLKNCGIQKTGVAFYSLRHTFRTIADGVRDETAIRLIMGHADSSIDARYVERIDDGRLLMISNHVRSWLNIPAHGGEKMTKKVTKKGGAE